MLSTVIVYCSSYQSLTQWSFNGKLLFSTYGGKLVVSRATQEHSGKYTCVGKDEEGRSFQATSTIYVMSESMAWCRTIWLNSRTWHLA